MSNANNWAAPGNESNLRVPSNNATAGISISVASENIQTGKTKGKWNLDDGAALAIDDV